MYVKREFRETTYFVSSLITMTVRRTYLRVPLSVIRQCIRAATWLERTITRMCGVRYISLSIVISILMSNVSALR